MSVQASGRSSRDASKTIGIRRLTMLRPDAQPDRLASASDPRGVIDSRTVEKPARIGFVQQCQHAKLDSMKREPTTKGRAPKMTSATTSKRRFIAVRLTDDELAMLREVSARMHTRSIDLATAAVRLAFDPKHQQLIRDLLDKQV